MNFRTIINDVLGPRVTADYGSHVDRVIAALERERAHELDRARSMARDVGASMATVQDILRRSGLEDSGDKAPPRMSAAASRDPWNDEGSDEEASLDDINVTLREILNHLRHEH